MKDMKSMKFFYLKKIRVYSCPFVVRCFCFFVIPAKAGIHSFSFSFNPWLSVSIRGSLFLFLLTTDN